MQIYIPLVALVIGVAATLVAAIVLEGRQHASRAVPVVRPAYRNRGIRRNDDRPRWPSSVLKLKSDAPARPALTTSHDQSHPGLRPPRDRKLNVSSC